MTNPTPVPKVIEYGLLYYDIPAKKTGLYQRVKRMVDQTCLPVNLSVYIFNWGLKPAIESKLQSMNAYNQAKVSMVKFDTSSKDQLERMVATQMEIAFTNIKERLHACVNKRETRDKQSAYLDGMMKKVKNWDKLMTIYEFTQKLEPSLKILRNAINEEYDILRREV